MAEAMTHTQISVITPVFNAERYLPALLASLSNQSEASLQIIVVDDGSTDDSLAIANDAARHDARITVVTQPNRGVSSARNHGLTLARGQWIAFADSDDWLHPDALRTWLCQAQAQSLDVLVGNGFLFEGEQTAHDRASLLKQQAWGEVMVGRAWIVRCIAAREWPHQVWLQLTKRALLESAQLRFVEGVVHEDVLWTMHLGLAAQRIGFAAPALYGWRENPSSITRSASTEMSTHRAHSYLAVLKEIADTAERQPEPELRRALLRHANHQTRHLVGMMRRHLAHPALRRQLARSFYELGLMRTTFRGCADAHDLWRAIRCGWAISGFAIARSGRARPTNAVDPN